MIPKNRHKLYIFILVIFFILITAFSSSSLIVTHSFFNSYDLAFHTKRIIELETSLPRGVFPSFSFNEFHGAASMILYPSINLLPIVFLHLFIKSNILLIYLFIDINVFCSLSCSYYISKQLNNSDLTSILFSILYSISFLFLFEAFYNTDLGVLTAMAFLPLAALGLVLLIKTKKCVPFILGSTMMIFSHVLSTLILSIFFFLFILINVRTAIRMYKLLLKSIIIIILLTSIVWVPILNLSIENIGNLSAPFLGNLHGISFYTLFKESIFGYAYPYLSIFAIIGLICPIIFYDKIYNCFSYYEKQLYWISVIFVMICSKLFPWDITNVGLLKIFRLFQFTYRFYIIPELLLSYLFSIIITNNKLFHKIWELILICISILLVILFSLFGQYWYIHNNAPSLTYKYIERHYHINNETFNNKLIHINEFNFLYHHNKHALGKYPYYKVSNNKELLNLIKYRSNISANDYYPKNSLTKINYIDNNVSPNKNIMLKNNGYNKFLFYNKKSQNNVVLPLLYYNGEKLRIYVNNKLAHYYFNKNNLITLKYTNKGYNEINIKYDPLLRIIVLKNMMFIIGLMGLTVVLFNHKHD